MTSEFVPASELDEEGSTLMPSTLEDIPKGEYTGCDPEDHEFEVYFGRARRCTICGRTEQALRNWWGQDLPRRRG